MSEMRIYMTSRRAGKSKTMFDYTAESLKVGMIVTTYGDANRFVSEMKCRGIMVEKIPEANNALVCLSRLQAVYSDDPFEPQIIGYVLKDKPDMEYHTFKVISV
jgi:hypothetical protein